MRLLASVQEALAVIKNVIIRQAFVSRYDGFLDYDIAIYSAVESES